MELQHDPRTKQQLKDILYNYLYEPVRKHYETVLNGIILQNCKLINSAYESFSYKGQLYVTDPMLKLPRKANRLAPALVPEMDKYLAEVKELNDKEVPFVLGFINQVLNSSNDLPDYLRVFPEAIHKPIQEVIATCGCRTTKLSAEEVQAMQLKNQASIELIKKRLVLNLLQ